MLKVCINYYYNISHIVLIISQSTPKHEKWGWIRWEIVWVQPLDSTWLVKNNHFGIQCLLQTLDLVYIYQHYFSTNILKSICSTQDQDESTPIVVLSWVRPLGVNK